MKLTLTHTTRTATLSWRRFFACPGLGDGLEINPSHGETAVGAAYQRPQLAISGI